MLVGGGGVCVGCGGGVGASVGCEKCCQVCCQRVCCVIVHHLLLSIEALAHLDAFPATK